MTVLPTARNFCSTSGTALYAEKITNMCAANNQSLIVRYVDLAGM